MKKNKINKIILVIVGICILLPLLNLIIWSFTERWAWPDLLPQTYSLRALNEITGDELEEDLVNKIFGDFCVGK